MPAFDKSLVDNGCAGCPGTFTDSLLEALGPVPTGTGKMWAGDLSNSAMP